MSNNTNDLIISSLNSQGYSGSLNDMVYKWLGDNGGTGVHIDDRWYTFLIAQGAVGTGVSALMYYWLGSLGYTGASLNDRWYSFWLDGGIISGGAPTYFVLWSDSTKVLWSNTDTMSWST